MDHQTNTVSQFGLYNMHVTILNPWSPVSQFRSDRKIFPNTPPAQVAGIESGDASYLNNGQGIQTLKVNGRLAMRFLVDPAGENNLFLEWGLIS